MDLASKSARIMEFCRKSSGFADFENPVDCGSAVNFGTDSGLCLSCCLILGHNRNLDHIYFFSLGRYADEFIQIISFFEKAHLNLFVRLLLELYCFIVIKHVTFFTICAKLLVTVAFIYLWDLNKNISGLTDLAKKGTDRQICIPLFIPLIIIKIDIRLNCFSRPASRSL